MGVFARQRAIDRLEDRLKTQADLLSELARSYKTLDLEFTNLFDKVSRQMSRMAKRYAVDTKELPDPEQAIIDGSLTESSDPISEAIHARRGRGFLAQ